MNLLDLKERDLEQASKDMYVRIAEKIGLRVWSILKNIKQKLLKLLENQK